MDSWAHLPLVLAALAGLAFVIFGLVTGFESGRDAEAHYLSGRTRTIFLGVGGSLYVVLIALQKTGVIGRHSAAGIAVGVVLGWSAVVLIFGGIFGSYNDAE